MTAREGFTKEVKLMWVLKNGQEFESEKICRRILLECLEKKQKRKGTGNVQRACEAIWVSQNLAS